MNVMLKLVENTWDDLELHYEIGKQNSPNWSSLQCNMLKNFKIMIFDFFFAEMMIVTKKINNITCWTKSDTNKLDWALIMRKNKCC